MTTASPAAFIIVVGLSSAGWVISVIAILIVAVIAWNVFGAKEDVERVRRRLRRRGPP